MADDYTEAVREQRRRKEEYFASDSHSPIPPAERDSFPGLDYFPVDPDYRYELELHERDHDDPDTVTVETTAEGERTYLVWGEFHVEVEGEQVTLEAYKADPDDDRLWVPFRDETNGDETYGAGRYLDLEADRHQTEDGTWVVDLNMAYNPTCAYNAAYECPLIPMANWLDVRIEAGEKDYPGETVEGAHH